MGQDPIKKTGTCSHFLRYQEDLGSSLKVQRPPWSVWQVAGRVAGRTCASPDFGFHQVHRAAALQETNRSDVATCGVDLVADISSLTPELHLDENEMTESARGDALSC